MGAKIAEDLRNRLNGHFYGVSRGWAGEIVDAYQEKQESAPREWPKYRDCCKCMGLMTLKRGPDGSPIYTCGCGHTEPAEEGTAAIAGA